MRLHEEDSGLYGDDVSVPAPPLESPDRRRIFRVKKVLSRRRLIQLSHGPQEPYPDDVDRPLTRGDCQDGPRPCPFVSCRYHLYLDTDRTGGIRLHHPKLNPEDLEESCALDVADRGATTLEEIGRLYAVSRETVRLIEAAAGRRLVRLPIIREIQAAGVEEHYRSNESMEADASHGGGRSGEKPPEEEQPPQPLEDRVWRTYERLSRKD